MCHNTGLSRLFSREDTWRISENHQRDVPPSLSMNSKGAKYSRIGQRQRIKSPPPPKLGRRQSPDVPPRNCSTPTLPEAACRRTRRGCPSAEARAALPPRRPPSPPPPHTASRPLIHPFPSARARRPCSLRRIFSLIAHCDPPRPLEIKLPSAGPKCAWTSSAVVASRRNIAHQSSPSLFPLPPHTLSFLNPIDPLSAPSQLEAGALSYIPRDSRQVAACSNEANFE